MPKPSLQRRAPLPLHAAQKQTPWTGLRSQGAAAAATAAAVGASPSQPTPSVASPKHATTSDASGARPEATQTSSAAGPPSLQRRGHASEAAAAAALASSSTRPSADGPFYPRGPSSGHAESDSDDDDCIPRGGGAGTDARGADDVDASEGAYTSDAYSEDHHDDDDGSAPDLLLTLGPSVDHSPVEEKKTITPSLSPSLVDAASSAAGARKLRQRGRAVSFDGNNLSAREASVRNARGHSHRDALAPHEVPAAATAAVSASTAGAAAAPCSPSVSSSCSSSSSSSSSFSHRHLGSTGVSPALDSCLSSGGSSPSLASCRRRPPLLALDTQFECSDEYIASMDSMRLAAVLATEEHTPPTAESQRERREQRRSARKQAQALESHYPHQQSLPPQAQAQQLFTRATRLGASMIVSDSDNFSDAYSDLDCGEEEGESAGPRGGQRHAPLHVAVAPRAHLYAPPSIPSAIPSPLRSPSAASAAAASAAAPLSPFVARRSPKHNGGLVSTPTLPSPSNKRTLAPSHSLPSLGAKRVTSPPSPSAHARAGSGNGNGGFDRDRAQAHSVAAVSASSVSSGRVGAAFPTLGRSASSAILPPSPSSSGAHAAGQGFSRAVLSPSRRAVSHALPAALSPQAQLRSKRAS